MKISIDNLEKLLKDSLFIKKLEIIDDSISHADHYAAANKTQIITHICIKISAVELNGMTRIEQHRCLYKILKPAIDAGLHAVKFIIN